MRRTTALLSTLALLLAASGVRGVPGPQAPAAAKEEAKGKPKAPDGEDKAVVIRHNLLVNGRTLGYTTTTGKMPIRNEQGEVEAHIFYVAYTLDGEKPARRPLMFSFNGGPGSSSVWLHLGALGPMRVALPDDASIAAPPFRLVENESTWLDGTDLVFIDPVGTGYSRATKPELTKKFHGLRGDIDSVAEFIRMYLTRNHRWGSPLYLVGESYGTTRAAGLSDRLVGRGIALNGIVLVSSVLNFQTLEFDRGNDLPYVLYLPSYTATAWYHKQLPTELQEGGLKAALDKATRWAEGPYAEALAKGDRLSEAETKDVAGFLAYYSGLDRRFVEASNLRVDLGRFCKELLRSRRRTVGRLDSRYKGIDPDAAGENPEGDPSMAAIRPPYTATFQQYVRADLGYETDTPYHILGEGLSGWDWGTARRGGYPDTSAALRDAMAKNPHMKVFVASGYYDLATPYRATEYTLAHMSLDPSLRRNIATAEYEAGHMMYVHGPSLAKLKRDVAEFLDRSRGR